MNFEHVLCPDFGLCYVRDLVCVMDSLQPVLYAGFGLCYVQFAVTNLVASLRACLASLAWLASLAAKHPPLECSLGCSGHLFGNSLGGGFEVWGTSKFTQ